MSITKILQPQYFSKFSCIGAMCENNCCSGWNIPIDKETYTKYRKCTDANLKPLLNKKVTRKRSLANDLDYARIIKEQNDQCPFFSEERLCAIQKKLGEDYLSITCATYPRVMYLIDKTLERSLQISCPEAARLILLNPNSMQFDEISNEHKTKIHKGIPIINTLNYKKAPKPFEYFWELRGFTIFILQNRTYPLWQRLIILGLLYEQLNQLVIEHKTKDIPAIINTYANRIETGEYRDSLESIPSELTLQLGFLSMLSGFNANSTIGVNQFRECYNEFLQGIHCTTETNQEPINVHYSKAFSEYYRPFMDQHEYIMENYLVNYAFKNFFPFGSNRDLYSEYIMMIIHYAMIKSLLVGIAGFHKEKFGIQDIIKLMSSFSRAVEHNATYLSKVIPFLRDNNFKNAAWMAILIKSS